MSTRAWKPSPVVTAAGPARRHRCHETQDLTQGHTPARQRQKPGKGRNCYEFELRTRRAVAIAFAREGADLLISHLQEDKEHRNAVLASARTFNLQTVPHWGAWRNQRL